MLYYGLLQFLPTSPMPGHRAAYALRRVALGRIASECGSGVIVKSRAYFGRGERLRVGNRSQLGLRMRADSDLTLGDDVIMGPDVVIMAWSHRFDSLDVPINRQGATDPRPVVVGSDVWIGTRVILLPGVTVGDHSVIGAGSVVAHDVPPYSVVAGVPARVIRDRRETRGGRQ